MGSNKMPRLKKGENAYLFTSSRMVTSKDWKVLVAATTLELRSPVMGSNKMLWLKEEGNSYLFTNSSIVISKSWKISRQQLSY